MCLEISDSLLDQIGLTPRQAVIEMACWLFDTQRLELWPAAQLAGLSRVEFEAELRSREIAIYRPTVEDVVNDLKAIEDTRAERKRAG